MGARALAVTTAPPPLHRRSTATARSALTCVLLHVGAGRTSVAHPPVKLPHTSHARFSLL